MALTPLHVKDICLSDGTCKYLCYESIGNSTVPICTKHAPTFYNQMKKDLDVYGINLDERSDNCKGYIYLKYHLQGYDV